MKKLKNLETIQFEFEELNKAELNKLKGGSPPIGWNLAVWATYNAYYSAAVPSGNGSVLAGSVQ